MKLMSSDDHSSPFFKYGHWYVDPIDDNGTTWYNLGLTRLLELPSCFWRPVNDPPPRPMSLRRRLQRKVQTTLQGQRTDPITQRWSGIAVSVIAT